MTQKENSLMSKGSTRGRLVSLVRGLRSTQAWRAPLHCRRTGCEQAPAVIIGRPSWRIYRTIGLLGWQYLAWCQDHAPLQNTRIKWRYTSVRWLPPDLPEGITFREVSRRIQLRHYEPVCLACDGRDGPVVYAVWSPRSHRADHLDADPEGRCATCQAEEAAAGSTELTWPLPGPVYTPREWAEQVMAARSRAMYARYPATPRGDHR